MNLFSETSLPRLLEACFEANWLAAIASRHQDAFSVLAHDAEVLAADALTFAINAPEAPRAFKAEIQQHPEASLALLGRVLKAAADQPIPVVFSTPPSLVDLELRTSSWVCFGLGLAALLVVFWQKLAASEEFGFIARRFGSESWARRLLRAGPCAAERTRWSVIEAWRRAALTPVEREAAVAALGSQDGGQFVKFGIGAPFDSAGMECVEPRHGHVASTISAGLKWRGTLLAKARVETATADFVALQCLSDSPLTARLRETLGVRATDRALRLDRAALYTVLDWSGDVAVCDRWLRSLCEVCPNAELRPIDPTPNEPLDERTMESEVRSPAPQHEIVAAVRRCGLRQAGDVLVRALVNTRQSAEDRRRF